MTKMKFMMMLVASTMLFIACKHNPELNTYQINAKTSTVEWKGNAPHHFHSGSFDVSGELTMSNDSIVGGSFTIPIASITNYELPDGPKAQLLGHLKSPDFFNVAVHPNAKFKITSVKPMPNDTATNYHVYGDFSLIGQTHPLDFLAKITSTEDSLSAIASFTFNRLKWGMSSYNDPKQQMYILPDIEIKLNLQLTKVK